MFLYQEQTNVELGDPEEIGFFPSFKFLLWLVFDEPILLSEFLPALQASFFCFVFFPMLLSLSLPLRSTSH